MFGIILNKIIKEDVFKVDGKLLPGPLPVEEKNRFC